MTALLGALLAGGFSILPGLLVSKRRRTLRVLDQEAKVLAALREADAPVEAIDQLSLAIYLNARSYRRDVQRQRTDNALMFSRVTVVLAGCFNLALALALARYRERLTDFFGLESSAWAAVPMWMLAISGVYFGVIGTFRMVRDLYLESTLGQRIHARRQREEAEVGSD